jgi:hypothetical protein
MAAEFSAIVLGTKPLKNKNNFMRMREVFSPERITNTQILKDAVQNSVGFITNNIHNNMHYTSQK